MQRSMTRNQLYLIEQEILSMKKESPALALLLDQRIRIFYEKAGLHLKLTKARFMEIQSLFIQKNELGEFLTQGEDDQREWKYVTDPEILRQLEIPDVSLVKEEFNRACSRLFSQTITFDY